MLRHLPFARASIGQRKHLAWVQDISELAKGSNALLGATLGVDKHQQRFEISRKIIGKSKLQVVPLFFDSRLGHLHESLAASSSLLFDLILLPYETHCWKNGICVNTKSADDIVFRLEEQVQRTHSAMTAPCTSCELRAYTKNTLTLHSLVLL